MVNSRKIYVMGLAFGLISALLLNYKTKVDLSQLIMEINLYNIDYDIEKLIMVFVEMIPFVMLQIFLGVKLYGHFINASAYYFIRQKDRTRWYLGESFKILADCTVYVFLYIIGYVVMNLLLGHLNFDIEGMLCVLHIWVYTSAYCLMMILLCNIIAIKTGSAVAFSSVFIFQIICVFLTGLMNKEIIPEGIKRAIYYINPFSNYVLQWHSTSGRLSGLLNVMPVKLPIWWSYLYFTICIIAVNIVGAIIVNRHDIMGEQET